MRPPVILIVALVCSSLCARAADQTDLAAQIQSFNSRFSDAIKSINNAAVVALWDDDGVTLLPNTAPIVGKKAIANYMNQATASLPQGPMRKFELSCFDIAIAQDWASEWCREHQIVNIAKDKPPFEGWGNLLLVLHRGADGDWRLKREMWSQALAP